MMKVMKTVRHPLTITTFFLALLTAVLLSIVFIGSLQVRVASAQTTAANTSTNADLRTAVIALLLADPRAAHLPQKEFDGMVDALVSAAQKKGLSAHDISWRPQPVTVFSQSAAVEEVQSCDSIICMINQAFGFSGPDITIPVWFGICSSILVLVVGGMIEVHRRKHLAPTIKAKASVVPAAQK
jgi:hypothetical protein